MKKNIALVLVFIFFVCSANAQKNGVHAFQAVDYIGKTVSITAM